jgi:hypothetical protein
MPELDAPIAAWRARLAAAMPDEEKTVRELEAHLRDHIDALRRMGMTPEAALDESLKRLGDVQTIAHEFSRARHRWWPATLPVRVVLSLLAVMLVAAFAWLFHAMRAPNMNGRTLTGLGSVYFITTSMGFQMVFATGLLGSCALVKAWRRPLTDREGREFRRTIFRLTVAAGVFLSHGLVLGLYWAGTYGRAWSWSFIEVRSLLVFGATWFFLIRQCRGKLDDRMRWLLAVLGNIVIALSWFAAKRSLTTPLPMALFFYVFAAIHLIPAFLRSAEERPEFAE